MEPCFPGHGWTPPCQGEAVNELLGLFRLHSRLLLYPLNCLYPNPCVFALSPACPAWGGVSEGLCRAQLAGGVNPHQEDNRITLLAGCTSKPLKSPRKWCPPDTVWTRMAYNPRISELVRLAVTSGGSLLQPPAQSRVTQGRLPGPCPWTSSDGESTSSLVPLQFCWGIAHDKS